MNILITGGAGYIGSHVVKQLLEMTRHNIIVVDNLSTGNINILNMLQDIRSFKFIKLDLKEFDAVDMLVKENKIDVVFHFAASISVAESIQNPLKYYLNNTINTTNLIQCLVKNEVKKFIFSSTAAVYGEPSYSRNSNFQIDETFALNPINAYGMSKLMSEKILQDVASVSDLKFIIFRYFNVAGADMFYKNNTLVPRIGELHNPETHLIPLVVQTALGKKESISIFGSDFNTTDGTCIRDYIHVEDLADIHIKAIEYLENNQSDIFNVGYGKGYSVKEVIETVQEVSKSNFKVLVSKRREGDSSKLIANGDKLKAKMNWTPKYNDLKLICQSAYVWEKMND
jgi:UDP-glucose 4-epimerase